MFRLRRFMLRFMLRYACAVCVLFVLTACRVSAEPLVTVKYVVDGDTVEIEGEERVRLLGIDAPENKRLRKTKAGKKRLVPAQPFFIEARDFLRELVDKKKVKIVVGTESVGYYGRTLAHLYLPDETADGIANGIDVQQELIRRGFAMVVVYPPNLDHLRDYSKTEAEACRAGRGIWGDPHFALQTIESGAEIRRGLGHVAGVVTSVKYEKENIRIRLGERVALLIYRGAWRKFWQGQDAKELIGTRIIARGRVKSSSRYKTIRIRHPFMLRDEVCGEWLAGQ